MSQLRYRLIDTAGGVINIIDDKRGLIVEGDLVLLPDGLSGTVVEVYDDEDGNVQATLVVEE